MNGIIILTWGSVLTPIELHGAHIKYRSDYVIYSSPLLPPGTSIYTWKSERIFEIDRDIGTLPLLEYGHKYRLCTNMTEEPKGSVYLKINMYQLDGKVVNEISLPATGGEFIYPSETFKYDISLITTTNESIKFRWLALGEADLLKKRKLIISSGLKYTAVLKNAPKALDIYVGRRDSEGWWVPIIKDHSQAFLRFSYHPDDFINCQLKEIHNYIIQLLKKYPTLLKERIFVRSIGYPQPELVLKVKKIVNSILE